VFCERGPDTRYEIEAEHADIAQGAQRSSLTPEELYETVRETDELLLVGTSPVRILLKHIIGTWIEITWQGLSLSDAVCNRRHVAHAKVKPLC
jgi:hypothetical protein